MTELVALRCIWRYRPPAWFAPLIGVALGPLLVSCGADEVGSGTVATPESTVVVFAAASLTDVFGDMERAFEAANPSTDVVINLAGSSVLREQILDGAPADVFAPADEANMASAVSAAEADGAVIFAHNSLQLAVPAGNPAAVTGLADLADPDLLVGLCAAGVPCGELSREVLAAAEVEPSIDTEESDVRALLTRIEADELDVGIVYVTDVVSAGGSVEGIEIPDDWNVANAYPITSLVEGPNPDGAAVFVAFVTSAEGRAILERWGFTTS